MNLIGRIGLVCMLSGVLPLLHAQQAADGIAKLTATREALLKKLDERLVSDARDSAPFEMSLTLDEGMVLHGVTVKQHPSGIRREPVAFSAFRFGQTWQNPRIAALNPELAARLRVENVDVSGLEWSDGKMTGSVKFMAGRQARAWEMGASANMHAMLKSMTRPVVGWSIGGMKRVNLSEQTYEFNVKAEPDTVLLELVLQEAAGSRREAKPPSNPYQVAWDEVAAMLPSSRAAVNVEAVRTAKGWLPGHGRSPNWNLGLHEVDASGLRIEGGRLSGELVVVLNPDPWVPGGGPVRKKFALDLPIVNGRVDGTYAAQEDGKESFQGRVTGDLWSLLVGEYRTRCVDGEWSGPVKGRMRAAAASVKSMGPAFSPVAGGASPALPDLYRSLSSILIGLRDYPPTPEKMEGGLRCYRPDVGGDASAAARCAEAMAAYAAGLAAATDKGGSPAVGASVAGDKLFGPFGDSSPMAGAEGKANAIPGTAGNEGPQRWQYPVAWQAVGPFVNRGAGGLPAAQLPGVVPVKGVAYENDRIDLTKTVTHRMAWRDLPAKSFPVRPPADDWQAMWVADGKLSSYSKHDSLQAYRAREAGGRSFEWYATTELHADRDMDGYMAMASLSYGRVWVNESLVWESGDNYNPRLTGVFPVRFKAGANRVLVLCGQTSVGYFPPNPSDQSHFRMWVCTAGGPRAGSRETPAANARGRFVVSGYHGDGARRYPDAKPPIAWNVEKGINIAWQQPVIPGGEPVVWGESMYMNAEPHTLLCLDKMTGQVRWAATNSLLELVEDAGWRAKAGAIDEMAVTLRAIGALDATVRDLDRRLSSEEIEPADVEALTKQKKDMESKIGSMWQPYSALCNYLKSLGVPTYPSGGSIGTFAATVPAVNEQGIWAYYGMGTVACYGHDGKRRWMVRVPFPTAGTRDASPLLVRDTVDRKEALLLLGYAQQTNSAPESMHVVMALDPADGRMLWKSDPMEGLPPPMVAVRISGRDCATVAVVTGAGMALDAFSGQVLHNDVFALGGRGIPYSDGERLFFVSERGESLVSRWLDGPGRAAFRSDWVFQRAANGGTWPISDGGCLYAPRISDEFHPHHAVTWVQLNVYDAAGGQQLSRPNPVLQDALTPEPIVMAGNLLFYSDSSKPGSWSTGKGQIAVMEKGEEAFVLARNGVGGTQLDSVPVFDGDRMYLRAGGKLVCIRVAGEAGNAYVEEAMADTVMQEAKNRPDRSTLLRPEPLKGFEETPSVPVVWFAGRVPVSRWLQLGPMPSVGADDPMRPIGGVTNARPSTGTEIRYGDATYRFAPIADDARILTKLAKVQHDGATLYVPAHGINVLAAAKRKKNSTTYFYSVIHVQMPSFVKYATTGVISGSWLSGMPIRDGDCLRLDPGYYPLMVRMEVRGIPPMGTPIITTQFDEIPDPAEAMARWAADINRLKPRLERIIEKLPGTPAARLAGVYLKQAAEK